MTFEVRQAQRSDVAVMLEWADSEGWNPGIEDADGFSPPTPRASSWVGTAMNRSAPFPW